MITLSKIALLAHVSVATVSKAFSMSSEVNEQTREMIFDIAKKYGCFKKFFNAKYPKFVVAVICPEFQSLHYSTALSYIQKYLSMHNCETCVASTDFSAESEGGLFEYYSKYAAVDAIISIGGGLKIDKTLEIPVVCIGSSERGEGGISLSLDYKPAMTEAIEYFINKDVKNIGFIGERLTEAKLKLFKDIIKEKLFPLNENYISITDERFEMGGYRAMEKLFETDSVPRALICAYDYMAIGAIKCIYDKGLRVPEDIAVLGMDDIPESQFLNPPLSSINPQTDALCRSAVDLIISRLTDKKLEDITYDPPKVCFRRSTEID